MYSQAIRLWKTVSLYNYDLRYSMSVKGIHIHILDNREDVRTSEDVTFFKKLRKQHLSSKSKTNSYFTWQARIVNVDKI